MGSNLVVYYGEPDFAEGILLVRAEDFEELSAIHQALHTARTWSDFWRLLPKNERQRIRQSLVEEADDYEVTLDSPDAAAYGLIDDAPFDDTHILNPDSYWPPVPDRDFVDWIPNEIVDEFGVRSTSMVSGEFVTFNITPERLEAFKAAFSKYGFQLVHDPKRIRMANGEYWRDQGQSRPLPEE